VQPLYVAFDVALAALSVRSVVVLRSASPWTSAGWAATIGYCVAAAVEFSSEPEQRIAAYVAYAFLLALTVAFVIAGVRDERQAEPWWWPTHPGPTRAEKRAKT
jgi:hypothetical protein